MVIELWKGYLTLVFNITPSRDFILWPTPVPYYKPLLWFMIILALGTTSECAQKEEELGNSDDGQEDEKVDDGNDDGQEDEKDDDGRDDSQEDEKDDDGKDDQNDGKPPLKRRKKK